MGSGVAMYMLSMSLSLYCKVPWTTRLQEVELCLPLSATLFPSSLVLVPLLAYFGSDALQQPVKEKGCPGPARAHVHVLHRFKSSPAAVTALCGV